MKVPVFFIMLVLAGATVAHAQQLDIGALPREGSTREVTPSRTNLSGSTTDRPNRQITTTNTSTSRATDETSSKNNAERAKEARTSQRMELFGKLQVAVDKGDIKAAKRISKQLNSGR